MGKVVDFEKIELRKICQQVRVQIEEKGFDTAYILYKKECEEAISHYELENRTLTEKEIRSMVFIALWRTLQTFDEEGPHASFRKDFRERIKKIVSRTTEEIDFLHQLKNNSCTIQEVKEKYAGIANRYK